MAEINCKADGEFPTLASVEKFWWGNRYIGGRDALIAAGVAQAAWFPCEPGQGKTVGHAVRVGRKIDVRRHSKKTFAVWERFTDVERIARDELEQIDMALTEQAKELARLPASHDDFRRQTMRVLADHLAYVHYLASCGKNGYRYAPEALREFDSAVAESMVALCDGQTLFNATARDRAVTKIKGKTAKADAPLQRFLQGMTQSPGEQGEGAVQSKIGLREKRSAAMKASWARRRAGAAGRKADGDA